MEMAHHSKANVCPYIGAESPEWESLGLVPDKIYYLYRDPDELAKAAPSLNGKPLLIVHQPVAADDHPHKLVVGSMGTDAEFNFPYLDNSMIVWDADAIEGIESGEQKELSAGYRYKPVMRGGVIRGVAYDGIMSDIVFNHVALVEVGRAGPDVVVGDSKGRLMSKKLSRLTKVTLKKLLAADADLEDFHKLLDSTKEAPPAADEEDDEDLNPDPAAMNPAEDEDDDKEPIDPALAETEAGKDEDCEKPMDAVKPAKDKKMPMGTPGMDAAIQASVKAALRARDRIEAAKREVRPFVGELEGTFKAPADVYKLALDAAEVDLKGVDPSAYGAMVRVLPKPGGAPTVIAKDAAAQRVTKLFPALGAIRLS
jgi:hypothetical protein